MVAILWSQNLGAAILAGNPGGQSCKIFVFACNPGGTCVLEDMVYVCTLVKYLHVQVPNYMHVL